MEEVKNTTQRLESEIKELKDEAKNIATKDDIKQLLTKDKAKNIATKDDIKRLETIITGLGASLGVLSEDAFRQGVYEILKSEGVQVTKEILYNRTGEVYGDPSDVEYDLMVSDGQVLMVEITSAVKRGDLGILKKKREFYEKAKNRKINKIVLITPFIHDRYPEKLKAMALDMRIEIVNP
ncbi:DUF3782 domain-containing protein [Metallosphaera hakonensis JCM 8857 = DSM 7519]|uniref:DUF3782 domain-containing protein n=1 Tax=Metallosphaera hakonensis JCM 8857 = DSM 7519 TaxID=1293036 RepID=A0A2U9IWS7_9CREN|nr:DUF3782 domain-containing protein [Metallosphaera hakonensis JCM 8857 = DSM 7519]